MNYRTKSFRDIGKYYDLDDREFIIAQNLEGRKRDAIEKGRDFSIDVAHLTPLPDTCPLLGTELEYGSRKRLSPDSATVDRIDNSKGYVPGNVWIISHRANAIKYNATAGEIMKVALNLRKKIKELEGEIE